MANGITFFKPNPRNAGFLFSFNVGPAKSSEGRGGELAFYVSSVAQASWDGNKKTGSFSANAKNPQKSINVKLNEFEIGGLINSIRRLTEWKAYHANPNGKDKVQISFSPAVEGEIVKGFFFSLLRNGKDKFTLAINLGECEALAAYFDFGLKTLYSNRFKNSAPAAQQQAPVRAPKQQEAPPQDEQSQGDFDNSQGGDEQTPEQGAGDENPFG